MKILFFPYICPQESFCRNNIHPKTTKTSLVMKIVIDSAIPYIEGVLEPFAEVVYRPGKAICADDVREADALVIRTRTRCDAQLLEHSRVRMIATATIGFDHIDLPWCAERGIEVATAAGCNARGVLQWIAAVLDFLACREGWHPAQKTLGIVGVGHVGSLVKAYAEAWGFRVVCCDPPREARERCGFLPLEEVARQADLLTFHTPLDDTTRHMGCSALFATMKPHAVVINSSRGEVVDAQALYDSGLSCVLDVWEHEPNLHPGLLERTLLATPHIAGYSQQGKANATAMSVAALARHFDLPLEGWYPPQVEPSAPRPISWQELSDTIRDVYDIEAESRRLKSHPGDFESLRDHYAYRKEYF